MYLDTPLSPHTVIASTTLQGEGGSLHETVSPAHHTIVEGKLQGGTPTDDQEGVTGRVSSHCNVGEASVRQ